MHRALIPTLTLLLLGASSASAQPQYVAVGDVAEGLSSWRLVDVRTGGTSEVTSNVPDPFGGQGSLEQALPAPGDDSYKAEVELFSPDTRLLPGRGLVPTAGGYGLLTDLHDLLVAWYRDSSSTAAPWLGTAVRVYVYDPDLGVNGSSSIMVWEPVYNGYASNPSRAVPVDQWVHSRLDDEVFWRQPLYLDGQRVPRAFCSLNPSECHRYIPLSAWGFGPNAVIFGFNLAVGSGWLGSYHGYVDYLSLELTQGRTWIWDFEPGASAAQVCPAPEPERRPRARRARRRAHRRR